jgi:protein tyrosine phosphatase
MKVVYIKLVNNEEIFGYLAGESKETYILRDSMMIEERINSSTGSPVIVLVNYVKFHTTETQYRDVEFKKSHVLFCENVSGEYERYFKISRTYYDKYVDATHINEIKKVTDAMEDVLYSPPTKPASTELKTTANNTLH